MFLRLVFCLLLTFKSLICPFSFFILTNTCTRKRKKSLSRVWQSIVPPAEALAPCSTILQSLSPESCLKQWNSSQEVPGRHWFSFLSLWLLTSVPTLCSTQRGVLSLASNFHSAQPTENQWRNMLKNSSAFFVVMNDELHHGFASTKNSCLVRKFWGYYCICNVFAFCLFATYLLAAYMKALRYNERKERG